MDEVTEFGFPKGRVAKTLRSILHRDLTDHETEAVVVTLLSHLLVEGHLNGLLYRWLKQDAPLPRDESSADKIKDRLWANIRKMPFASKYSLIEPYFEANFPSEASDIWKLNDLRTTIFHGKALAEAKFKEKPLSTEEAVESIFMAAQAAAMQLDKFEELVDSPHALAERWSKRLKELGEPLL